MVGINHNTIYSHIKGCFNGLARIKNVNKQNKNKEETFGKSEPGGLMIRILDKISGNLQHVIISKD